MGPRLLSRPAAGALDRRDRAAAAGPGGPTAAGSGDFVKEEIIELQEMRLSPIPSIRNRFAGSGSKVTKCFSLDTHRS